MYSFSENLSGMKSIVLLFGLMLVSQLAFGQPGSPSAPAPLGFVELLIGSGIAFGGYKGYKKNIKM